MKGQVPGAGPADGFCEGRLVWRKGAPGRIEAIDHHLIDSQVGRKDELVVRIGVHAVGEGPGLPSGMNA